MNTRFVSRFICAGVLLFSAAQPANSIEMESTQLSQIDSLSSDLMSKVIELLKLNTRLKMYLLPRSPWSGRRQSGLGFTNATLTSVGAYMNGVGRLHYLYTPKKAPLPLFEDAGIVRFLANAITCGAQVFEFCNDTVTDIKDKRQGVSLSIMRKRANELQQEIDGLLEKRKEALAELNNDGHDLFHAEQSLFADMRDAATNEFAMYYSDAKANRFSRRLGYVVSLTSNITSGAGTIVGIESAHLHGLKSRRRTHMGAVGGITDIITGSINVAAPFIIKGGQIAEAHFARKQICQELLSKQTDSLDSLLKHEKEFQSACAGSPQLEVKGVVLRQGAMQAAGKILEKRYSMLEGERKSARGRFYENVAVAAIAGGSKITNGIGSTVGGFKYDGDSYHRLETLGGTAIAYGTGNALAALETARVRLKDEFKLLETGKNKSSKRDILNQQLKQLEDLQSAPAFASKPGGQTL